MPVRALTTAVLVVFLGACGAGAQQRRPEPTVTAESDLAGIERLHRQDIAATVADDLAALAETWTDDAVRIRPGGKADVGKAAIRAADERGKARHPGSQIVSYVPEIKDVRISAGWAFEWGTFTAGFKETPDGEVKSFRGTVLRVLQRQPDGSWRFSRVMVQAQ